MMTLLSVMLVTIRVFQVLYLQQNKLKSLPSSLGNLAKLTTLNLSENALKVISVMVMKEMK